MTMRMIYDNVADRATLGASPALVAALPVENLQDYRREFVARTTGVAAQTITVTFGDAEPISGIALYRGNFSADATWRIYAYESSAKATLLYDSGALDISYAKAFGELDWGVDPLGVTLFSDWDFSFAEHWFALVVAGYLEIVVTDSTNPDGYMQWSRLVVGSFYEARNMPISGMALLWKDTSTQERTESGAISVDAGVTYRSLTFAGQNMQETDRLRITDLLRKVGMRSDVYLSPFAGDANALWRDYAMLAMQANVGATATPLYGIVNQSFQFEEI